MTTEEYNNSNLYKIRHTAAHLLAMAALEFDPEVKLAIGPPIESGFYYDFDFKKPITEEDLKGFEKTIQRLINKNIAVEHETKARAEAITAAKKAGQVYKAELMESLPDEELSHYSIDTFSDLCKGPHATSTGEVKAFKLLSLAGAYWHGDETQPMLTRIYGTAFENKKDLEDYLNLLEEAKKRDHRKLGAKLGLFIFSDLVGPGMPLYKPKGALLRKLITGYSSKLRQKIGYQEVYTPNMNKAELFKVSGHYDKYKEDMFLVVSNYTDDEYYLKPMNCPQHTQIFASEMRSYKDLPIRIADTANLYRDEKPGELSGLTRLRSFCQDDGHSFCREDQIESETTGILSAIKEMMATYELDYHIRLSLRDEKNKDKYLGDDAVWEKSQKTLKTILDKAGVKYEVAQGEAAFYGPKMDLLAKDSLGREWQLSTIQLDFNMPKRFGLEYIDNQGEKRQPVMIHNALIGSVERFMALLIEHCAGAFPFWLSPVQIKVLPISDVFMYYAKSVTVELNKNGFRVELDESNESLGKKIRNAEIEKTPYIIIIGEKEVAGKTVTIRSRQTVEQQTVKLEDFVKSALVENKA